MAAIVCRRSTISCRRRLPAGVAARTRRRRGRLPRTAAATRAPTPCARRPAHPGRARRAAAATRIGPGQSPLDVGLNGLAQCESPLGRGRTERADHHRATVRSAQPQLGQAAGHDVGHDPGGELGIGPPAGPPAQGLQLGPQQVAGQRAAGQQPGEGRRASAGVGHPRTGQQDRALAQGLDHGEPGRTAAVPDGDITGPQLGRWPSCSRISRPDSTASTPMWGPRCSGSRVGRASPSTGRTGSPTDRHRRTAGDAPSPRRAGPGRRPVGRPARTGGCSRRPDASRRPARSEPAPAGSSTRRRACCRRPDPPRLLATRRFRAAPRGRSTRSMCVRGPEMCAPRQSSAGSAS